MVKFKFLLFAYQWMGKNPAKHINDIWKCENFERIYFSLERNLFTDGKILLQATVRNDRSWDASALFPRWTDLHWYANKDVTSSTDPNVNRVRARVHCWSENHEHSLKNQPKCVNEAEILFTKGVREWAIIRVQAGIGRFIELHSFWFILPFKVPIQVVSA